MHTVQDFSLDMFVDGMCGRVVKWERLLRPTPWSTMGDKSTCLPKKNLKLAILKISAREFHSLRHPISLKKQNNIYDEHGSRKREPNNFLFWMSFKIIRSKQKDRKTDKYISSHTGKSSRERRQKECTQCKKYPRCMNFSAKFF